MKNFLPLAASFALAFLTTVSAQEYQGAPAILKRLAELAKEPSVDPLAATPAGTLRKDLERFRGDAAALPPDEAAVRWLALVDRFTALSRNEVDAVSWARSPNREDQFNFKTLLVTLPPPAAWDALAKAVEARLKATGANGVIDDVLRLIAHTLVNAPEARWKDAAALRATLKKERGFEMDNVLPNLSQALLQADPDPKHAIADFEGRLAARESSTAETPRISLAIPDLVTLAGETAAAKLLQRALLLPHGSGFDIAHGEATKKLARQLALKMAAQLKRPPWGIIDSLDSVALFAAMEKRFPARMDDDPYASYESEVRTIANGYNLLGLIAAKRTTDALKFAVALGERRGGHGFSVSVAISTLARGGQTREVFAFLNDLLSQHPEMNGLWRDFIELAPQVGESEKMLATLRSTLASENLPEHIRPNIRQFLGPALLAADQIEDGVKELLVVINAQPQRQPLGGASRDNSPGNQREVFAFQVARIGKLMQRQDWIDAGLAAARKFSE